MKYLHLEIFIPALMALIVGLVIGIKSTEQTFVKNIYLRAINEDYENEVILEINGDLYENNEEGKFYKYYSFK